MNIVDLKTYIFQNNLIPVILDKLKCKQIKMEQGGRIITACLPNGNNPRSIQVKNNPFLDASIRSRNINKIDIFDVVSYIYFDETDIRGMGYSRDMAINWVRRAIDIDYSNLSSDSFKWAYEVTKKSREDTILDKSLMNVYFPYPHINWLEDGIEYNTQLHFGVMYNLMDNQIVFPVYNDNSELIGIKARNLDYKKGTSIPKYIYLNPFFVGGNLYGLNESKDNIRDSVIIFEAEKSVMKAWQFGYKNTVALACKELTNIQVDLLNKYITPETEIILAYDKDVYWKNDKLITNQLKQVAERFTQNKVFCIIDMDDSLSGAKDSPVDCGKDIFEKLLENKKRIK